MIKFEVISKYQDKNINLPQRKTTGSAGYDFEVAEDIIIPSYSECMKRLIIEQPRIDHIPFTLSFMEELTKTTKIKPTLVPTGIKCCLEHPNTYLELSVRSSCPLKYWLIMANNEGIIDADYYNNESNEGHIYFQLINLSPYDIKLSKGDVIGQGIIKSYLTTDDDSASGKRIGGFGSTNK